MQRILRLNLDSTGKSINIQVVICLLCKQDETVVHVGCVLNIPGLEDSGSLPSALSPSEQLEVSRSLQKSLETPRVQAVILELLMDRLHHLMPLMPPNRELYFQKGVGKEGSAN